MVEAIANKALLTIFPLRSKIAAERGVMVKNTKQNGVGPS